MITVHGTRSSGNCYKVQLLLDQLGIDYCWQDVDILAGQTRTPVFLARNPDGKVPVLELDDGRSLAESGAILCYLAEGTPLFSGDAWARAQTLQWMFFEQYSHEPYVAVARFIALRMPADDPRRAELPRLRERGMRALSIMERHLSAHDFFGGNSYGIADIALFAYTHCAADGGIELGGHPAIAAWLERVRAQPGFSPMQN
jgi:glutathione S-transferase